MVEVIIKMMKSAMDLIRVIYKTVIIFYSDLVHTFAIIEYTVWQS